MPDETVDEQIDQLVEDAAKPHAVSGDSGSVTQNSIKDRIDLIKFQRAVTAQSRGIGIKYVKFVPPGTV